jgi:hypothetical protein
VDAAADRQAVQGGIEVVTTAEWIQLAVDQGGERTGEVETPPGRRRARAPAPCIPVRSTAVSARALHHDGAWASAPTPRLSAVWAASPRTRRIAELPLSSRLIGLHGAHDGRRGGTGGDFRDIHPYAPGDELRRIDWRATARVARRPGELLVRRTNALSDSAVVIALDTADDLGPWSPPGAAARPRTADPRRWTSAGRPRCRSRQRRSGRVTASRSMPCHPAAVPCAAVPEPGTWSGCAA